MHLPTFRNPIFVALDVDDPKQALQLTQALAPHVGGFKIGPRLLLRAGPQLAKDLSQIAPLFIDFKFFDIPSTTVSAVETAAELGATFVTVHAHSAQEALQDLAKLQSQIQKKQAFLVLAITVLTSQTQSGQPDFMQTAPLEKQVDSLADITLRSGLQGLVCAPTDVSRLRKVHPQSYLVCPGIRLPDAQADDQKRVMGPHEAVQAGANVLVVGRPIIHAKNPQLAAKAFAALCK